jgi:hypothetical protein
MAESFEIERIRSLCGDETIVITKHAGDRLRERGIRYRDIKAVIMSGTIIEEYPTDYPNPSVLMLGYTDQKDSLHVVVGIGGNMLQIITAYRPSFSKWENDFKTRKGAR